MPNEVVLLHLKSVIHLQGHGALEQSAAYFSGYTKIFVLVDENTEKFCLPLFLKKLPHLTVTGIIRIKSGEENKNIRTTSYIWQQLTRFQAERGDLLINLGGGVITDMGGFAAATFKRGIDCVQVPTTLLGQVDAAIGFKTGIDFENYKNQVGLFAEPKAVIIDPVFLDTLNEEMLRSGFAELLKYAFIGDIPLWEMMHMRHFNEMKEDLPAMISRAVRDKIQIVEEDRYETGLRKLLNFGHTVGHALETFFMGSDTPVSHGDAVAAGMICAAWISAQRPDLECIASDMIFRMIDRNFPRLVFSDKDIPVIMQLMQQDKKNRAGKFRFTLLHKLGKAVPDVEIPEKEVEKSLLFYLRNQ